LEFVFKAELLVDRSRLIAATAEPFDSFSAWVVSSSRASASQQNSHVRASLDRPLARRGTTIAVERGFLGSGPKGSALRLRWRLLLRCRGVIERDDDDGEICARGGDGPAAISSALPSSDKDSRT